MMNNTKSSKKNLRIVFMGSPEFAVASLEALVNNDFNVVGVITAPDKLAGRGKHLKKTEVKIFAENRGLKLLQPENLKDPNFIEEFKSLHPNLGVVVAFRMLPEAVWSYPEYGTFNLHASLLPQYRGAAPINHAIINGEKETGLTTFFLQHEIDTGNIILQERLPVFDDENFGHLQKRMMEEGARLVIKTIRAIESDTLIPIAQDQLITLAKPLKPAPKIFKDDCRINWENTAENIHNLIRGLSPSPGAFTTLVSPDGKAFNIKILRAKYQPVVHNELPGTISTNNKNELVVHTRSGIIMIEELQMAGKKSLSVQAFLNGFKLGKGWNMQ